MDAAPRESTWRLSTTVERPGAIGVVQLRGDIDAALAALGIGPVPPGQMRVRDLAGIDLGVVARVRADLALLMPHGGREILRQLGGAMTRAGLRHAADASAQARYPEARSPFEAELLDALARAASPRAIDLLLGQPRRWREHLGREPGLDAPAPDPEHSRRLDRLVTPPMVVAVGASNIGKSTLLNRLCGRVVASVADEPGTTRDHVGSMVDLDGLVVRWVDTPGRRPNAPAAEREALAIADALVPGADLVVGLGDAGSPPPELAPAGAGLAVALRADLGVAGWAHALAVSAATGEGMAELAGLIRRRLVPDAALASPGPWRFWG
jgi:tRNA modification GTPase